MARSTFRVLFYANGSKEKNGIVPIMGRVTINGTVAQFSCKRNRLEIEMGELLLDIMASVNVESVSFCLNDIIPLLVCSQVKVEKSQVRKVVQECLMKRERQHNAAHRFSFGKRFDETLMKGYCISCLYIRLSNHQFIGFSALIKSAGETAAPSLPVCCCANRQSCRHNGTEYQTKLAKRKRRPMSTDITADTIAGFWGNKKP